MDVAFDGGGACLEVGDVVFEVHFEAVVLALVF